jgi:hypothetical protein
MKRLLHFGALALLWLLSACAVLEKPEMDAVRAAHVEPYLLDKMRHGDPLAPGDIILLSRRHVADDILVRYIERTGVNFALTRQIATRMRTHGVSDRVLRAVSEESRRFVEGYHAAQVYVEPYYYPGPIFFGGGYYHHHHH